MLFLPIVLPLLGGLALFFCAGLEKHLKPYLYGTVWGTALLVWLMALLQPDPMVFGNFPFHIVFALYYDHIGFFFSLVFVLIWLVVTPYALDYLAHDEKKVRFFGAFLSLLGAMLGLCYAYNIVTFYLFFEMVSLCSVVLVAHEQTESAIAAGKKFFYYSMAGAFIAMVSVIYFYSLKSVSLDPTEVWMKFTAGGIPEVRENGEPHRILIYTLVAVIGFGCKAGMFPLHGWLKTAHPIAPAPASAVLSGITTKAGILGIIRILYYVVGVDYLRGTYVQQWGLILSVLTIFMGSMLAYREKVLKTRLAYSTVSQVSYVIFGLFLFDGMGFVGALLHVFFHATAKTLLFLCAGTYIHQGGVTEVEKLEGMGKRLPTTTTLFTIAGLSLVGLPFTGGFISKVYLALGAVDLNDPVATVGVAVIIVSAMLTAGYLMTVSVKGFYPSPQWERAGKDIHPFPREKVTYALALVILVFGTYPTPLIDLLETIAVFVGLGGSIS